MAGFQPYQLLSSSHIEMRLGRVQEQQDEVVAEAFKQAQSDQQPVTREYLDSRLKADLDDLKLDLIKWVPGALIAQAAVIATLVKRL